MDIYLNRRERENSYFSALGQSASYDLLKMADIVSTRHINDFLVKGRFKGEIKALIDANIKVISSAKNDTECRRAINNIKEECISLERQGTMLSLGKAKVFMSIAMEKHKEEIGYVINGIGIGTSLLQMYGGFGAFLKSSFIIGKIAGAHLVFSGASSFSENIYRIPGNDNYIGFMEKGYQLTADFMGFDKRYGSMSYHAVDMASSLYGLYALNLKTGSWRLFKHIPGDYYRTFTRMTNISLSFKFIGAGNKIRIISDINAEISSD